MTAKVIDYFCNVFTPQGLKKIFLDNPEVGSVLKWWNIEDRIKGHSPEAFIDVLDAAGIDKVLIPISALGSYDFPGSVHTVDPEDVIPLTEKYPDRFYGIARLNPYQRMRGVKEIESLVRNYNFKGVFFHPFGFNVPLNGRDVWPFYAKCEELGVPVVAQVGHSAERMPSEMGRPIYIDDIALYFPELKFVASHTGWPWVEELVAVSWKHKNVFIGCAAHAPKYWDPKLVQFMNSRGIGKVMWGTDYPILLHTETLDQVEKLDLKPEACDALLWKTARDVFKL
ncbi:MAG: amidohydrolase [Nitrospirae bacterium]|nr:amidohydrolase [Nitrospirota bacterium]